MFDLIGEVFERAQRDTFLRWVNNIGVADSGFRDDDL